MKKIFIVSVFLLITFSPLSCKEPDSNSSVDSTINSTPTTSISQEENTTDRAEYAKLVNTLAEQNGFSAFLWDTGGTIDRKVPINKYPLYTDAIISSYPDTKIIGNGKDNLLYEEEDCFTAVKNMRAGWNLGNTLDSTSYNESNLAKNVIGWIVKYGKKDSNGQISTSAFETAWGNPLTTQEIADYVIDLGFNAIRIPITWAEHIDKNNQIHKEWLDRVQQTVDYFYNRGVYCIINMHHDGGGDGWIKATPEFYEKYNQKFADVWAQIANRFIDYDERLLFESMNEVIDTNKEWNTPSVQSILVVNDYNQLFVDTVRATGGNNKTRNLVLMTYAGSGLDLMLKNFVLPKDSVENHLIIEVHNYEPHGFTWTDATWTKMTATWNKKSHAKVLQDAFTLYKKYSKEYNAPFIIGEYGADSKKYADYK